MTRKAILAQLGCVSIALCAMCGCSYEKIFPPNVPLVSNQTAIDRALRLCSLTEGDVPFHLILDITPPRRAAGSMRAQVEVYWLNGSTYRTVIHSASFSQVRIVNGPVIEEHNTGDFYPRWIQNFVDALLDPVPRVGSLRTIEGSVPVSTASHACIARAYSPDKLPSLMGGEESALQQRICFTDVDPKLASGEDFTRYVSFDDFAPFGSQQIARTLVNVLPANTLVNGRIIRLEPLQESEYGLLKARQYTPPAKQIQTRLVAQSVAKSLLQNPTRELWLTPVSLSSRREAEQAGVEMTIYVRTDRQGRVREAYRDNADVYGLQDEDVSRAMNYRFKPLIVRGVALQMEAPITMAARPIRRP